MKRTTHAFVLPPFLSLPPSPLMFPQKASQRREDSRMMTRIQGENGIESPLLFHQGKERKEVGRLDGATKTQTDSLVVVSHKDGERERETGLGCIRPLSTASAPLQWDKLLTPLTASLSDKEERKKEGFPFTVRLICLSVNLPFRAPID
mmetsp:Transcript_14184/g.28450  ORF Transcript_14184/g.28450 Transcript_14184/m.28450 type:complete len:149 (-) Transcript_14184:179-625(-)